MWALGCCLYSLAFLQNCFEEGSNLAIISRNYKIPDDNPYGDGLVELIDRMLTVDDRARGDMTEVILCLSAIYSGRPLPPRRKVPKAKKKEEETHDGEEDEDGERVGAYRTDGQGILEKKKKKKKETPSTVSLNFHLASPLVHPRWSNSGLPLVTGKEVSNGFCRCASTEDSTSGRSK